jgi:hypothetical protein
MSLDLFGDFGFVGSDNTTANPYQDRQQTINWYVELSPSKGSKTEVALLGCPGLIQLATAGPTLPPLGNSWPAPSAVTNLPVRGAWVLPGKVKALVVIARTCYLVTVVSYGSSTTPGVINMTSVGTLQTSTGPVVIRDDGVGLFAVIVDGPFGYLFSAATSALTQINDPAFLGATHVAFIDGWWIFNQPNTQVFYTNAAQYSTAFKGSNFALKDAATDLLMGVIENKEELWLIGESTTEIWYDAGGAYFGFARLVGTMLQAGCKARYSIARLFSEGQDGLIWFGRSERGENVVVRTKGFAIEVISTPAISHAIAQFPVTSDAIGYTYQEDGHEFYMLIFPSADRCYCYDASLPPEYAWHQRLSYDPYAGQFHRHRSNAYMNFAGMRIVGDYQNGSLYQLTRASYTDAGWPILARRRTPHIWNKENRERVFMASLQVDIALSVANQSGLGSHPHGYLSMSRDGGATYGSPIAQPFGQVGQNLNRLMWRKLGFTRDAVVQLDVIDPVNRDIVGATLRAAGT